MDGMEIVRLPKDELEMAKFISREGSPIAVQIRVTRDFVYYTGGKLGNVIRQNESLIQWLQQSCIIRYRIKYVLSLIGMP